jgi:cyclopropane fatty-acyl-phospholipid synthase-like methyltransferase
MKEIIKKIPVLSNLVRQVRAIWLEKSRVPFLGSSAAYWEERYARGGNSGVGSYGRYARFKAEVINAFLATHSVDSVIEFGCGDGNQLELMHYPHYMGFDISDTTIASCKKLFGFDAKKEFRLMREYAGQIADLAVSLDVIYHLVEDEVFEGYMKTLFSASSRYIIIYSSDMDNNRGHEGTHIRHSVSLRIN